jgi:hypothetical protein
MAMSGHRRGLLPLTQTAMQFYNRISSHDFEGFATEEEEAPFLARDLGVSAEREQLFLAFVPVLEAPPFAAVWSDLDVQTIAVAFGCPDKTLDPVRSLLRGLRPVNRLFCKCSGIRLDGVKPSPDRNRRPAARPHGA